MIVFISGSSKLKSLDKRMTDCLDEYMAKKVSFIVGDCYGADELAQDYLKKHNYEDVTVYCSTQEPRWKRCRYTNYVSLWEKAQGKQGEDFYQIKDKAMCEACDEAVAFWNGNSYGVKCNLERCFSLNKPTTYFIAEGCQQAVQLTTYLAPSSLPCDPILGMPHLLDSNKQGRY
ncbi:MAG: hypothetical protein IJF83_04785 [Methanobrevibacter sp.]|nr:hypothetical protein [Methanobrevibacter sp.]MBQ6628824.1 hypothetical protein [Methanobrevibacter sp.]